MEKELQMLSGIKERVKVKKTHNKFIDYNFSFKSKEYTLSEQDYCWLIEQASQLLELKRIIK